MTTICRSSGQMDWLNDAAIMGAEMELTATLPEGGDLKLLKIDDWDLDWQDTYQFAEPITLPAGTVIHSRIVYDNSSENPENPHQPPQRIEWGRESTDEMGSLTLSVVPKNIADQDALQTMVQSHRLASMTKGVGRSFDRGALQERLSGRVGDPSMLMRLLDKNRNGSLERDELPERMRGRGFDRLDADNNDSLDAEEVEKAREALERLK